MPLPEKEYFALEEIERRWGTERVDTIYYAENGLLGRDRGAHVRSGCDPGRA